jgi:formylglycine-generating enzyme required for sulfatase activity
MFKKNRPHFQIPITSNVDELPPKLRKRLDTSWSGADAYCKWRAGQLPTEAQWEKAARGGLQGKLYSWGDDESNCSMVSLSYLDEKTGNYLPCVKGIEKVGSYDPNGCGLYDMIGNTTEWVADWYSETYYDNPPYLNPPGPYSPTNYNSVRSSWWSSHIEQLTVFNRFGILQGTPWGGFRCFRLP